LAYFRSVIGLLTADEIGRKRLWSYDKAWSISKLLLTLLSFPKPPLFIEISNIELDFSRQLVRTQLAGGWIRGKIP
jgi:hypothetical protein